MTVGRHVFEVMSVPGHTADDVAYYSQEERIVFTGDTLFAGGCGRVFSGDAARMWTSLMAIRDLPGETNVYCGHEYTVDNLEFAAHLEPGNKDVLSRLSEERRKIDNGLPTVPSCLDQERITNPFLRCDDEAFKYVVCLAGEPSSDVFADIRKRKNRW